mgnify:CR=1 FL=1
MFPLVWVSVGIFCGLVSYSAKLWGQPPDVFLPIVTTIVYGLIVGLPFGWPWPHGTFIGPFNRHLTHSFRSEKADLFSLKIVISRTQVWCNVQARAMRKLAN